MSDLKKLAHQGDAAGLKAWLDEQTKAPPVGDLLWCALATESDEVRRLLVEIATRKKITPKKKGWPWNDALAVAIVGDPAQIAKAEKRGADFEAVAPLGTPLTTAIRFRHLDFVRALLDKGVDTSAVVKMARIGKLTVFGNFIMTSATPLGVALRDGCGETANVLFEHVAIEPVHLADAVQGGNETLLRRVLGELGNVKLEPKLFWSVRDPKVVPILAEHGLDLSKLPTDTGTWGGPIWSWWASYLQGGDTPVERFAALFATGVRATAAGLGDILEKRNSASTEMVDLFVANGADLSDELEWEGDGWDETNDCEKIERGSVAERLMRDATVEIVRYVHEKGAAMRPMRANPDWYQADEKKAWLESLGLVEGIDANAFPWMASPSDDEVRSFLAHEEGIYGLKLGMTRDDMPEGFDLARAEEGDGLWIDFNDEGRLTQVNRQYFDLGATVLTEALTAALGKPKGRGKTLKWKVPGGIVKLREDWTDAGLFVYLNMNDFD